MCGIAGFCLRGRSADVPQILAMCDAIRHRGPDDGGHHLDGGCAIGMRRLSILDLTTGAQPMANEDRSVWVVFNGEIYNYKELRELLCGRGHRFRTRSDTEVLVHLYEEEGVGGIERLRGMFAYAIWDSPRGRLLLARDRFGKKPLYYAAGPHGFWFASEMKCLRGAETDWELDPAALRLYFKFGYIPDPYSPFRGIRKLPAGGWLRYENGDMQTGRYWRPPVPSKQPPPGLSREQAAVRLRALFDESVRIRLEADVPLGAFLSGGIDSSSVVASMALQSGEPVKTFSIGFEEAGYNELDYARLVAERYRTEHQEIIVRPDAVSLVARLTRHFDEPFADSSAIPTLIVSEFAERKVKVALTGDGGDELLAGYESFFKVDRARRFDLIPRSARRLVEALALALPYRAYGKNYLHMISRRSPLDRYFELNYPPHSMLERLLEPEWMPPSGAEAIAAAMPDSLPPAADDVLASVMYFETAANLTGDMLVKVDRMSMAASLEVRCPLLDHRLAEFAAALPHSWKMDNGKGKAIFLEAVGSRLPDPILRRGKMGFGVPLAAWFRGPLREMLWDNLTGAFLGRGFVRPAFVRYLLNEHHEGRRDNSHRLWGLLMMELWFRQWLDALPGDRSR